MIESGGFDVGMDHPTAEIICHPLIVDPTAISSDVDAQIRHLSDGAIVLKSHEQAENEYEKTDEKGENLMKSQRSKRSIADHSRARRRKVVETLVVADSQLVRNHAHDRVDVTTYILTVMNMVSSR